MFFFVAKTSSYYGLQPSWPYPIQKVKYSIHEVEAQYNGVYLFLWGFSTQISYFLHASYMTNPTQHPCSTLQN
jgi:hypothetical protein